MRSGSKGIPSDKPEAVRIKLLGGFSISVGSRTIDQGAWHLKKAATLVKLLALSSTHRLHREQAMELLWPDFGRRAASNNLRKTLHTARKILDPAAGSHYLVSEDESLVLCPKSDLWMDVEAFEEAAATARRSRDPAAYRAAIDLYAGDLLPVDLYEEWTESRRHELRTTYLALCVKFAGLYEERGEYEPAIEALRRVVAEEPNLEEAHAGLMRLYALSDRRREALAQYERLRNILLRELGAEPDAATRGLHEEIAAGRLPSAHTPPAGLSLQGPTDTGRHNLPAPRTSFVGREREMVEVKRALAMTRLLTLTGAGGSGKTRLALEVARELMEAYPDGVWLVELAGLSEGTLVLQAVARTLEVREQPGQPIIDTLAEALRDKDVLLILDNCEHLADSVAHLLDTLLGSCLRLRILATSREAVGVVGEVVWRVPSLSVPGTDRLPTPGGMTRYEAVRLFVERARLRSPAFELTLENAPAVAEVCRKLEGIPLAIELATARMGTLSVGQISERLQDPLSLLSAGGRTAVPRQQTLRATLDWSYELLSQPERTLFGRLSVFAGGWTLEAAEAVAAGDDIEEGEVLNLLSGLVDKSLVVTQLSGSAQVRYRMLEPVRQYARGRLEESGEVGAVRRRHAAFFRALAEQAEQEFRRGGQEEWLERLEREHNNLRAALGWSFSQGEAELGLRLAAALWEFWDTHGHLSEGEGWLKRGISATGHTMMRTRAKALNGAGWIALFQGNYGAAKALVEESLALYRELGDKEGIASALTILGYVAVLSQRDLASVPALLEEAMGLRPELRDRRTVAHLLLFAGLVMASQFVEGQSAALHEESLVAQYRALHEESLGLFREIRDARGITFCLTNLGLAEWVLGNYDQATTLLRELLHQSRRVDAKLSTQYAFFGLAGVAASQGQLGRATRLWAAADAVREASGIQLPALTRSATDYEGRLGAVRAELGAEAFERAWVEGRAMTLEEITEYALSDDEKPVLLTSPLREQAPTSTHSPKLTRREEEVAVLVARGLTNRQIAAELVISEHTVATHIAKTLKKLGLSSRSGLSAWMTEQALPSSN